MQPRHRAFKQELDKLKKLIPQDRKLSQDIQNLKKEEKELEAKKTKELFDIQTDLFFIFLEKFSNT